METGCRLSHTKDTCPLVGPLPAPPSALREVQVPGGRRGLKLCRVLGERSTRQGVEPPQLKFHRYEVPGWLSSRGALSPRRLFRRWAFGILTPWPIFPKGVWMGPRLADSHCSWG